MEPYKNIFKEKSETELYFLYQQFLESEETGSIPDNELGKIRDKYCDYCDRSPNGNGVLMMILDLTRVIADRWYHRQNPFMLKLSIGTKVCIRPDLEVNKKYGTHCANEEMLDYAGKEATIVAYEHEDDCDPAYLLDIDDKFWSWSDEMFEETIK